MGPEKTSFFQALQIPTKISRGTIEILNEVHIIKLGEKVGASEAALLNMLNIQPFSYGLAVQQVILNFSYTFNLSFLRFMMVEQFIHQMFWTLRWMI